MCFICNNQPFPKQSDQSCCIINCDSIISLPKLPETITELWLCRCDSLREITEFPCSLRILKIYDCYSLKKIPSFPSSLLTLFIVYLSKIININFNLLPPTLNQIYLINTYHNQEYLHVHNCKGAVISLPDNLEKLHLKNFNIHIETIGNCKNLHNFELIQSCEKYEYFPKDIEKCLTLRHIHIDTTYIKEFPRELWKCANLQTITCYSNDNILCLPKKLYMCKNLQKILIKDCKNLTCLLTGHTQDNYSEYSRKSVHSFSYNFQYIECLRCPNITFISWLYTYRYQGLNWKKVFINYENYRKKLCGDILTIIKEELLQKTWKFNLDFQ